MTLVVVGKSFSIDSDESSFFDVVHELVVVEGHGPAVLPLGIDFLAVSPCGDVGDGIDGIFASVLVADLRFFAPWDFVEECPLE